MDSHFSRIFQLLLISITILQIEGITKDELVLLSPKPRRNQSDYSCMVGNKNEMCCTCPESCGQTYPRTAMRTYSKGIKVLRLYFTIKHPSKTNQTFDPKLYLCPRNSTTDVISRQCLLENPLHVLHKSQTISNLILDVQMPPDLSCHHCLIQWVLEKDGQPNTPYQKGKYFGCSDIAILSLNDFQYNDVSELGSGTGDTQSPSTPITPTPSTQPAFQTSYGSTTPSSTTASICWAVGEYSKVSGIKEWCNINCLRGYCPETHCKCSVDLTTTLTPSTTLLTTTTLPTPNSNCLAVGVYANVPGMNEWCDINCRAGNCPETHCKCSHGSITSPRPTTQMTTSKQPDIKTSTKTTTTRPPVRAVCLAVGAYAPVPGMNVWCERNCKAGYCPSTHCKCSLEVATSHSPTTRTPTTTPPVVRTSRKMITSPSNTKAHCMPVGVYANVPGMDVWCDRNCKAGYCPETHCKCVSKSITSPSPSTSPRPTTRQLPDLCLAVGPYANDPNMDEWCNNNCKRGYCPDTHCRCSKRSATTVSAKPTLLCKGAGLYVKVDGMDQWCQNNCPENCPATHCKCSSTTKVTNMPLAFKSRTTTYRAPICRAIGIMATVKGMHEWCSMNCKRGYCPESHCQCSSTRPQSPRTPEKATTASATKTADTKTTPKQFSLPRSNNAVTPTHTATSELPVAVVQSQQAQAVPPLLLFDSLHSNTTAPASMASTTTTPLSTTTVPAPSTTLPVSTTTAPAPTTTRPVSTTTAQSTTIGHKTCKATAAFSGTPGMDSWCNANCNNGYCPKAQCQCDTKNATTPAASICRAIPPYSKMANMHKWCQTNCASGYCPPTHCQC